MLLVMGCRNGSVREPRGAQSASEESPVTVQQSGAATITPADMRMRIGVLANDSMRGRSTPSPGLDATAAYIAREFQRFGLTPGGDNGSFIQRYMLEDKNAARAPNVVGILRGSDPRLRDTYVVFSAHMDHVGVGTPDASGDSIYNGADDDASGTSAVVEVAEAFASLPEKPKRSLIFLTVSGEEKGLLGSQHFAAHPPVPVRSIVANINIDMIGRNAPDTVVAIGREYTSLGEQAQRVATQRPELKLTVAPDLWPAEQLFFRSDHFSFASKDIPAIFFFAGLHGDYHKPSDEVEKIDPDKAARIARLIYYLGSAIAEAPEPPQWTREGLRVMRSLR
jgi:hypothetical protein